MIENAKAVSQAAKVGVVSSQDLPKIRSKADFEKLTGIKIDDSSWNTLTQLMKLGVKFESAPSCTIKLGGKFLDKNTVNYQFYSKADNVNTLEYIRNNPMEAGKEKHLPIMGASFPGLAQTEDRFNEGAVKLVVSREENIFKIKSYNVNGSMDLITINSHNDPIK
jgi:hypothetical protein